MALVPQYINFMHTDLLRQTVNKLHDPIPDEEIEAGTGTKRIKVTMEDTTTTKDVKRTQGTISRNRGIDESVIVYGNQSPG